MVIAKIFGGLGNQLFIYAAARRLALKNNVPLKLDITSGFKKNYNKRVFQLSHFNINAEIASKIESFDFCMGRQIQYIVKKAYAMLPFERRKYIVQSTQLVVQQLLDLRVKGKIFLEGYWQSEEYFTDITNIIREELTFKEKSAGCNKELAEAIAFCPAVSIHVRRGDYVSNAKTRQFHGLCGLDYYCRCIKEIIIRVAKPHFFIFSDDFRWCRDNLKLQHPVTFIEHNRPDEDYEDLRLMSLCKHHIIANSSFSWWGAWLNPDENKIVLAPEKWFAKSTSGAEDIIPDRWERR